MPDRNPYNLVGLDSVGAGLSYFYFAGTNSVSQAVIWKRLSNFQEQTTSMVSGQRYGQWATLVELAMVLLWTAW